MSYADRVKETTATIGPDSFVTAGAELRFRTFAAKHSVGDSGIPYCAEHATLDEWEVGLGTLIGSMGLSRDTILASSNGDAIVNFSAGTKYLYETVPASVLEKFASSDAAAVTTMAATDNMLVIIGGVPKQITVAGFFEALGLSAAQLSAAGPLAGPDILTLTQDGTNEVQTTLAAIAAAVAAINAGGADTTAPTLSSPTGSSTGTTTASGTVVTNEANGTLYFLASTNTTETAATVKASGGTQAITTTGTKTVNVTGLTESTTYYLHYVHRDAAGNDSTVANSGSFTTSAAGDVAAPTLSSPLGTETGQTTASGGVTTDEATGTLYSYVSTNASETAATVKASGQTQAVSASGAQTVSFTGLTAATTYYAHYVHRDAAGNDSVVADSASFTTAAATETITVTTPTTQAAGTAFTLAGTYANGTPTALDYSLDSGATWTAATSPTISGGNYSFSLTIADANASQTVKVRDHDNTSIVGTSSAFTVSAADVAYTIAGYSGNAVRSTIDASAAPVSGSLTYISPGATTQTTVNVYWSVNQTSGGAMAASAKSGWGTSATVPPDEIAQAQNQASGNSINGMTPMTKGTAFGNNSFLWVTDGSGTTGPWYFWVKPVDGAAQCMNPSGTTVTGA